MPFKSSKPKGLAHVLRIATQNSKPKSLAPPTMHRYVGTQVRRHAWTQARVVRVHARMYACMRLFYFGDTCAGYLLSNMSVCSFLAIYTFPFIFTSTRLRAQRGKRAPAARWREVTFEAAPLGEGPLLWRPPPGLMSGR